MCRVSRLGNCPGDLLQAEQLGGWSLFYSIATETRKLEHSSVKVDENKFKFIFNYSVLCSLYIYL